MIAAVLVRNERQRFPLARTVYSLVSKWREENTKAQRGAQVKGTGIVLKKRRRRFFADKVSVEADVVCHVVPGHQALFLRSLS